MSLRKSSGPLICVCLNPILYSKTKARFIDVGFRCFLTLSCTGGRRPLSWHSRNLVRESKSWRSRVVRPDGEPGMLLGLFKGYVVFHFVLGDKGGDKNCGYKS